MKSMFEQGTVERILADIQLSNYTGVKCPMCGQSFDTPDDIRKYDGRKGALDDVVCAIHWNQYAAGLGISRRI